MRNKPMHPVRRLLWIISETEQFIRDVNYWNSKHPSDPPLDFEPERVIRAMATEALAAWHRHDLQRYTEIAHQLGEYAKQAYAEEASP